MTLVSEHRMHDDRGQEAECSEPERGDVRKWAFEAHPRQFVDGQRAQIPHEAEQGCQEQERIETRSESRRAAGAYDHREQHRVEHDAGTEPDQVQQLADVQGGRHGTSVSDYW